jgi:TM2 domain-containing membrane protein YozV
MFCSNCGAQNTDTSKFCEKCGGALTAAAPTAPAIDTRMRGVEAAPHQTGQVVSGKNPTVAVALSFLLAGVGQFYNGDVKKGALMLGGSIVLGIITGGLVYLAVWIWSMIDAYQVANGKAKIW